MGDDDLREGLGAFRKEFQQETSRLEPDEIFVHAYKIQATGDCECRKISVHPDLGRRADKSRALTPIAFYSNGFRQPNNLGQCQKFLAFLPCFTICDWAAIVGTANCWSGQQAKKTGLCCPAKCSRPA